MNAASAIVNRLLDRVEILENDDVDDFLHRHVDGSVPTNQELPKLVEVRARCWYARSGGAYHKSYIYLDGKLVHVTEMENGAGSMYEQTASAWLDKSGLIPPRPIGRGGHPPKPMWQHLQHLGIQYSRYCTDVKRERDL